VKANQFSDKFKYHDPCPLKVGAELNYLEFMAWIEFSKDNIRLGLCHVLNPSAPLSGGRGSEEQCLYLISADEIQAYAPDLAMKSLKVSGV